MNRIYQGRVSSVEMLNPDNGGAKAQPWLFYHRDAKRAAELTKRIPELRLKVERLIKDNMGWSGWGKSGNLTTNEN